MEGNIEGQTHADPSIIPRIEQAGYDPRKARNPGKREDIAEYRK